MLWTIAALLGSAFLGSCPALAYAPQDLERLQEAGSCLECDLSGADLTGVVRGPVDLRRADLHGAILAGADLSGARLGGANLRDADLGEAILEGAGLNGANLDGANLEGALLREADLTRAILWNANLSQADLYRSLLRSADLQGAKLAAASLEETDLSDADLRGADLEGAELYRSSLRSADLRNARLVGATLQEVDLSDADLAGADLAGASLIEVTLDGANLAGVDLPEAEALQERSAGPMPDVLSEEDGAAGEAPERSEPPVRIFYGTDRRLVDGPAEPAFSGERGDEIILGTVEVTIPREHQSGIIELQSWLSVAFGLGEDPDSHFTIHKITTMEREPFLEEIRATVADAERYEGQLFVFIHGYNTSFEAAAFRTAQIAYDLQFDGAPVMYSWPSRASLTSYEYDQISATRSRRFLKDFLLMLERESGVTRINLIAHSMGNLALMEVIRDLNLGRNSADHRKVLFNQVILAAPDIDRDLFLELARQIKGVAERVTLYASSNDLAMDASRTWAGSVPRAGDVPEGGPLVSPDLIDTIDASAISTSMLALNHSGYAEDRVLLNDIGLLWQWGHPPSQRSSLLWPMPDAGKPQYWKFR